MPTFPAGYYNTFDPSKKYYQILALAGYVEQAREDNEIQAMLLHALRSNFDTLYKNESLIDGGMFAKGSTANQLIMQAARVYRDGIVHEVPGKVITLNGTGTETVGVKFVETVVTAADDVGLKDPAIGYANYGQPGAARLKIEATWVVNDAAAINYYTFVNGNQQTQPRVGQIDIINQMLARRTYDESGNYTVSGFDVSVEALSTNQVNVVVSNKNATGEYSGSKGYVQGNEIIKLLPEKVATSKALDVRLVQDERVYYDGATNLFELASQPGARIIRVNATFDVIRTINNHNFNGYDELIIPGETLVDVLRVYKGGTPGSPTTAYVKATSQAGPGDFYRSGNGIRWDVAGSATDPISSGDSFQAYFLVRKTLQAGEFQLTTQDGKTYLDITSLTPKPYRLNQVDNSAQLSDMDIDYEFYLSRVDVVYVDASGALGVVRGTPEVRPVAPSAPAGVLALGQIMLPAGGEHTAAKVTTYPTRRKTQLEINKVVARLERAEYNQAIKDLNDDGVKRAGNSVATLKGILTESFTYSAEDIQLDGVDGISRVKFVRSAISRNMLNIENRELNLPLRETQFMLTPAAGGTTAIVTQDMVISPYTAGVDNAREQLIATNTIQVNEFGVGDGKAYQTLDIFPTGDTSTETEILELDTIDPQNAISIANSFQPNRATFSTNPTAVPNQTGFLETAALWVADQWIYVRGSNFTPGALMDVKMDNLAPRGITLSAAQAGRTLPAGVTRIAPAVTFDGTPDVNGVYSGITRPIVNVNGEFDFFIRVPQGIRSGSKVITITSHAGDNASSVFEARATRSLAITASDASAAVMQAIASMIPPTPPNLSTVVVRNGVGGPVLTDVLNATVTASFEISWDAATGGTPNEILLVLSNGTTHSYPLSGFSAAELTANKIVRNVAGLSTAFGWEVIAVNNGGSSVPRSGTVLKNTLPPNLNPPTLANFQVVGRIPTAWQTNITLAWTGMTGVITRVTVVAHGNYGRKEYANITPALNGQIVIAGDYDNNTVVMTIESSLGTITRTLNFSVPRPRDPVAQTFAVDADGYVDGVGLFFSDKPPANKNFDVMVEIRKVDNGYPMGPSACLLNAKAVKTRAQVVISADASAETYFKFRSPAFLKAGVEYAIVVTSDSNEYKLFYAKVGNPTILAGGAAGPALNAQAYLSGVMFTSSNNEAWTAHQASDLKFRVRPAAFNRGETLVTFDPINGNNMVGLYLPIDTVLPGASGMGVPPTRVSFEYQIDGAGTWFGIEPDTYEFFSRVANTYVLLRARLQTDSDKLAPAISRNADLKVMRLFRDLSGVYLTKTAQYAEPYRYVRMIAKQVLPSGTNIRWFVSDNTAAPGSVAAYNAGTAYVVNNMVTHSGATYVCIQAGTGQTPASGSAYWAPAVSDQGVIWRELPALGETKVLTSDGTYYEHERTLDLGANGARTQFRFRTELSVNSVANSIQTPRMTDIITICNA